MPKSRLNKSNTSSKSSGKNIPITTKGVAFPQDPGQELKNGDPLDMTEEMMENVFDREPESR